MDRAHWTSPSFRGRSPHPRHSNPRFRGGGGGDGNNFGTPTRHFSPHWQQRSPSPYRYQSQLGQGPSFGYYHQQGHHHPYASTPVHGSGGGRRPFFRGGGGGGRFNKRQSFGSPSFGKKGTSGDDIDNWVSPEMWADPWKHLTTTATPSVSNIQFSNLTSCETTQEEGTKFAESDFNITPSGNESDINELPADGASRTKFADSDFNVTDSKSNIAEADQPTEKDCTTNNASSLEDSDLKSNKIARTLADDDDFEKLATDRVVLDTDDQLLS